VDLQLQSRRTLGVSELLAVGRLPHPARAHLVLPDTVVRNGRGMHGTPVRGKSSSRAEAGQ
jgi:hypothetical protein